MADVVSTPTFQYEKTSKMENEVTIVAKAGHNRQSQVSDSWQSTGTVMSAHHFTHARRRTGKVFADFFRLNLESKVALRLYGNHRDLDDEEERQEEMARFVIHPMSVFRFFWDLVLVFILFFQVLILPVNIAFFSNDFSTPWLVINGISDAIFLIDIVLNFFTGIPSKENEHLTILSKAEICKRYLKSWFIIDFCSSFPFDYIFYAINSTSRSQALAKAPRGLKILKLAKLLSLLKLFRLMRLVRYMRRFEDATNLTSSHLRMIKLIAMMLLLAHWSGCIQYFVPYLQDFPPRSWVAIENLHLPTVSVWEKYTWSLFKAMSHMLSIGYGRSQPLTITDAWMHTISMMIGGAFFATFIGGISTLSLTLDSAGRHYTEKLEQVNEYLKFRKIPISLRHLIGDYYIHRFQRKCFDEEQILRELSPSLREEILMYHLGDLLRSVSFFKDADIEFLHEIVPLLQFEVYLPDEIVIKGGKKGNKMFFIEHGILEVVNASGHVTAILGKGNHFGEISLMTKEARRVATVRTKTKCDLFSLSRENFHTVLEEFPHMKELMRYVAELRLQASDYTRTVDSKDSEFWDMDVSNINSDNKSNTLFSRMRNSVHPAPSSEIPEDTDYSRNNSIDA